MIEKTIGYGGNATILAYGQTASGKTFTIQGTDKEPGIILRAINFIAEKVNEGNLSVTCWMAEIYM